MSEAYHSDDHILGIFSDVESRIKECYVREDGGGNVDNLKLAVVSYKILKSGGFNYFTKVHIIS